jgi:2-oxoisovalerate dehydrogenase E2 component (dihydrolipoyl transacylase)
MKTFKLPDLGEGLAEAEIIRWHVKPGERINIDAPMLAVETAKAVVEVPSPWSGVVKATYGNPGDAIATGSPLVEFESDAGTVVGSMPTGDEEFVEAQLSDDAGKQGRATALSHEGRIEAVPAARALAKRLRIDLTRLKGTGRSGLITVDDVVNASAAPAWSAQAGAQPAPDRLHGPRRSMAQTMAHARDSVMGCTLFDDADLHHWEPEQDITARLLRAIAEGCTAEPTLNAWFDGEAQTFRMLTGIDVAIAVDTAEGLIVPVVRDIAARPVADLRRDVDRLKRSTRERTVAPEDLRDFSFMLSNFGMIAGRYATPVVVPPAVAILGSGRLSHDVVAVTGGGIESHLRMPLSLTFDHRCVTGGEAARFMAALIRDLQKGS